MKGWDELEEDLKASNRAQACHISLKLQEIGCTVTDAMAGEQPFVFEEQEVERLAEMEHGRYCAERLLEGWRWGETRDDPRKLNPYLVGWAALPPSIRELDCQTVRKIPQYLAGVGLAIRRGA